MLQVDLFLYDLGVLLAILFAIASIVIACVALGWASVDESGQPSACVQLSRLTWSSACALLAVVYELSV